ncbi:hypothetical protein HN51_037370, partial [Arachis hypogaea]
SECVIPKASKATMMVLNRSNSSSMDSPSFIANISYSLFNMSVQVFLTMVVPSL